MFEAVANLKVDREQFDTGNETSELIGTTRSAIGGNRRVEEEYPPALNPNFIADSGEAPYDNGNQQNGIGNGFVVNPVSKTPTVSTFGSEPAWNNSEIYENGFMIEAGNKISNGIDTPDASLHNRNDAFDQSTSSVMNESRKEANSLYSLDIMIRNQVPKPENRQHHLKDGNQNGNDTEEKRRDISTTHNHTFRVSELLAKKDKILGGNIQTVSEKTGDSICEESSSRIDKISFCTRKSRQILSKKEKLFGMMSLDKQSVSSSREEETYLVDVMTNAFDTRSSSGCKSMSSLPTELSSHSCDAMETGSFVDEVNVNTEAENQPDYPCESLNGSVSQATFPLLAQNNDTSTLGLIVGDTIQNPLKGDMNEREQNQHPKSDIEAANDEDNYLSLGINVLDNIQMPSRNDKGDAVTSVFSHASCGTSSGSLQSKVVLLEPSKDSSLENHTLSSPNEYHAYLTDTLASYNESAERIESKVSAKLQEYQPSWTLDSSKHMDIEQPEIGHLPSWNQMILPREEFVAEHEGNSSDLNISASIKMEETEKREIVSSQVLGSHSEKRGKSSETSVGVMETQLDARVTVDEDLNDVPLNSDMNVESTSTPPLNPLLLYPPVSSQSSFSDMRYPGVKCTTATNNECSQPTQDVDSNIARNFDIPIGSDSNTLTSDATYEIKGIDTKHVYDVLNEAKRLISSYHDTSDQTEEKSSSISSDTKSSDSLSHDSPDTQSNMEIDLNSISCSPLNDVDVITSDISPETCQKDSILSPSSFPSMASDLVSKNSESDHYDLLQAASTMVASNENSPLDAHMNEAEVSKPLLPSFLKNIDIGDDPETLGEVVFEGAMSPYPTSNEPEEELGIECSQSLSTPQNRLAGDGNLDESSEKEVLETSSTSFCCSSESSHRFEGSNATDAEESSDFVSHDNNSVTKFAQVTSSTSNDPLNMGTENIKPPSSHPQKDANLDSDGIDALLDLRGASLLPVMSHNTELGNADVPSLCPPKMSSEASGDVMAIEVARVIKTVEDEPLTLCNIFNKDVCNDPFNSCFPLAMTTPLDESENVGTQQSDIACLNTNVGKGKEVISFASEATLSDKVMPTELAGYAEMPSHYDSIEGQTEENELNSNESSSGNAKFQLDIDSPQITQDEMNCGKNPSHHPDVIRDPSLHSMPAVEQTSLFEREDEEVVGQVSGTPQSTGTMLEPLVIQGRHTENADQEDEVTSVLPYGRERPKLKNRFFLMGIVIILIISSTIFIIGMSPRQTSEPLIDGYWNSPPTPLPVGNRTQAPTPLLVGNRTQAPTPRTIAPIPREPVANNVWRKVGSMQSVEAGDETGHSFSMTTDGNRIVIGAMRHSYDRVNDIGAVRTYDLKADGKSWILVDEQLVGQYQDDQFGASVSISGDGRKLAVGAPGYDIQNEDSNVGKVYLYNIIDEVDDSSGVWLEYDVIIGNEPGGNLGYSVSFDPDGYYLAMGAPYGKTGIVLIYMFGGNSTHGQLDQIGSSVIGTSTGDKFGLSVSLSMEGRHIAVGAPGKSCYVNVYTYDTVNKEWQLQATAKSNNSMQSIDDNDEFGFSISISDDGTKLAVGAPGFDATKDGKNEGRVYLYKIDSDMLVEEHNITGNDNEARLGSSLSFSSDGHYLAIGSPSSKKYERRGSAQVFQLSRNTRGQLERIGDQIQGISPLDLFGSSLSLFGAGKQLVVGAPDATGGGTVTRFDYYTNGT